MLMGEFVFKRQCGRCPAVEEVPVSVEDIKKGVDPSRDKSRALQVKVGGEVVVDHDFLCDACNEICTRYAENISKQLEKKSATRSKDEGGETEVDVGIE